MIIFVLENRPPQMLIKVTARQGDDLYILTNGVELATISPMSKEKAERYLLHAGWKRKEVNGPKFETDVEYPDPITAKLQLENKALLIENAELRAAQPDFSS